MHQRYDDDDDANDIDSSDDDTMRNSDMIAGLKGGGGGKKRNYRSTAFSNVTPLKNHSVTLTNVSFFGSGPDRGRSLVEWGEVPLVPPSVRPSPDRHSNGP